MSQLKMTVSSRDHIQGNHSASIIIVEYGDYQCPHCGAAYPVIKEIQQKFGDQIGFVFRNFPLAEIHQYANLAALATEAADLQGKFWEMHDVIFEHQASLSENGILQMAEKIGLDLQQFEADIQDPSIQQKVDDDFESGVRSGVNGTPSFFINGNKFDGDAQNLFEMLMENSQ